MSKKAIITGGSEGLGLAIAHKLAREGYTPILVARTQSKLSAAVEEIQSNGYAAVSFAADITDTQQMKRLAETIEQTFGSIDFLVNNAGAFTTELLEDINAESISADIQTCLFGSILCTKLFAPLINPTGKILFVSSGFGLMGPAGYSVYAACKAGMINFAEAVKRELHCRNISVYVAVPGDIDTPSYRKEEKNLPDWLNISKARGDVMPAEKAAGKIIDRCRGKRFFIFSHFDVFMLHIATKILPRRMRDSLLDRLFIRP